MAAPKGHPKWGGHPKGGENKTTRAFKEAVLNVFNDIGGEEHFTNWALENPTEFYKIAARLIPTEVTGTDGGVIEILHTLKQSVLDEQK